MVGGRRDVCPTEQGRSGLSARERWLHSGPVCGLREARCTIQVLGEEQGLEGNRKERNNGFILSMKT